MRSNTVKKLLLVIISVFSIGIAGVDAHLEKIKSLLSEMEYKHAQESFEKAISEFDSNAELYYLGGEIAIKLDNLDGANKNINKAIELDIKNEDYRAKQENLVALKDGMTSARKTFDSGDIENAIIEFEKLTQDFKNHAIVFYNLGRIYKANGEYDLAVDNYKQAIVLNPFEDKYSKAIKAIAQEMAKNGDTEYRRQEFDAAIENYLKAISYVPEYTTALFKIARTYFKLKDYENTKLYLEKNLSVDPNQEQSEKMLGDIYKGMGDLENAIHHYNLAISINGNYYKAYYSLGTALLKTGELEDARIALNQVIMIEPTYAKALGTLGYVEQELGNLDMAVDHYTRATELDPKSYDVYYRLASALNLKEKYEDAKSSAKSCLNIKRNYAPAYFELGMAEKALGNKVAAIDAFEKAKKDKNWRKSADFELNLINKGL